MKRLFSTLDNLLSAPYRNAPVLDRESYSKHNDIRLHSYGASEPIYYREPQHCQRLPKEFSSMVGRVEYPQPFMLDVANGELHGRHAVATTQQGEIVLESLLNHRPYLETVSAGRIHYPKSFEQLRQQLREKSRYKKVFVLVNHFGNAYFHWLLESLPRLWLLKQYEVETGESIPVLIDTNPSRHVVETLRLLGIHDVIEWKATAATAEHLLIPMAMHGTGIPSPFACRWLADALLSSTELPSIKAPLVYISRAKTKKRRVVNEAEVIDWLEGWGFQSFFLEEMSLAEQMALFKQAKLVAGPHGAGFSNVIFSYKLKLLEFFEPSYLNACFYRLASGMRFDYAFLLAQSKGLDMKVDVRLLEALLDEN
jgi:hypothetical protein